LWLKWPGSGCSSAIGGSVRMLKSRSDMAGAGRSVIVATLDEAERELELVGADSECEVGRITSEFEGLAREAEGIVRLATAIVDCVETDDVLAALEKVETLGCAARKFLQERLKATGDILEIVGLEARLLMRLAELTHSQRAIARETQTLSVLTNIEVARLGEPGAGFRFLARQLADFSQTVSKGTRELSSHTQERKISIDETRRMLAMELPKITARLTRMEFELDAALRVMSTRLTELSRTPERFRASVAEIAGQIAGVVAAVQSQDITRQRVEHVSKSVHLIRSLVRALEDEEREPAKAMPSIVSGLLIQTYQLRSVAEMGSEWISQIRDCMDGILRVSSSDVAEIGPGVLREVKEFAEQLDGINALEQESQAVNGEVQSALGGLSSLMGLLGEHLKQSTVARDQLRLITFNAIIEASHLESDVDAILEISQSIKRLAEIWSELTERSRQAMGEILRLVETVQSGLRHFSEEGSKELRAAQAETRSGLERLRHGADEARSDAQEIESVAGSLQGRMVAIGATADRLDGCVKRIGGVEKRMDELKRVFESQVPGMSGRWDEREAEEIFAGVYTTEIERAVLRAALRGEPVPSQQQGAAGNDVELF
jgi:flagellin-specific chaperone FliS